MELQNAKQDIRFILSFFSEAFSRPSFKIFSAFVIGFVQLGKEFHTSSMVQSLTHCFLHRSLSSFTRFLGQNIWAMEEVTETALYQFFHVLGIKAQSVLFLIVDDTIAEKTGKKIPGCAWHRDHTRKAFVFGHQWVLSALLYKDFLLPLWAKLYHPKGTKGSGPFRTKSSWPKGCFKPCDSPSLVKSTFWRIVGIGQRSWLCFAESVVTI